MTVTVQNKEMMEFSSEQKKLIKDYLCKGISDDELNLFSAVCKKTGLDPFMKQIYAVKRKDQMTIQTSIDGYRLIAERTGRYAPGRETTFHYGDNKQVIYAIAYVMKQTADGTWHETTGRADWDEFKPTYASQMWDKMPHVMLSKCAEAVALRKAFPNELSGLYTKEEMYQADNDNITTEQLEELIALKSQCSQEDVDKIMVWLKSKHKCESFTDLSSKVFPRVKEFLETKAKKPIEIVSQEQTT